MASRRSKTVLKLLGATALGAPFAFGAPAAAQEASDKADNGEIVVTATRRAQDVTKIPYNISAVSSEQVSRTGVGNIEDLSRQIPNLVVTSSGNQFIGAQRQIMRGLNASNSNRYGVALEQNPVSSYLGNAPFANYFQVTDLERVEVLRGPQGTLYGAGTLGGAIRLIPTAPVLGKFSGRAKIKGGMIDHSDAWDYGAEAVINIPLGDTFALRASVSHDREGGFIDQFGTYVRQGSSPVDLPVLVNPANPLTSPAQTFDIKDVNKSKSTDVRVAVRWKPSSAVDLTIAYNRSRVNGFGPNFDSPDYNGGPDPLLPATVYPNTGEYEVVQRGIQPFDRKSDMVTGDASIDLGFATLSSTTSYFETTGATYYDGTWGTLGLPPAYLPYYTGSPANPRFQSIQRYNDHVKAFTQEIRLVSNGGGAIDYILGAYYQHEKNYAEWSSFDPGQIAYNGLPGVTVLGYNPLPGDQIWMNAGTSTFRDRALFGEVTWHATPTLDIAGGARVFKQSFARDARNLSPVFGLDERSQTQSDNSSAKFRFNATWEYLPEQRGYFTFSQGFRRGGANTFTATGYLREPESLRFYKPDTVNNFELGLKGRVAGSWRYTADVFLAKWENAQIGGFTAVNFWPVVFNAGKAESKGFEFELSGKLMPSLNLSLGYSYTDAKLTEDFCLPSGDGSGRPSPTGDIACAISGIKGTRLPSAPEHSATFTLNYEQPVSDKGTVLATFNGNYKSSTFQILPTTGQRYPTIPGYWLFNGYLGFRQGPVTIAAYAHNLFDKRVIYASNTRITPYAPIDLYNTVGRPRTFGLELSFDW